MAIKVTKAETKLAYDKKLCSLLDEYRQAIDVVEIITPVKMIKKGDKVGSSKVTLLAKLGIRSFSYGLVVLSVCDNGSIFSREVLNLIEDSLIDKFTPGVSMIALLSLALSYPTIAPTPYMFIDVYKNVLDVTVDTEYTFIQVEGVS
ncbi:60S acidic ribosomal protein P0-like [Asparagus officinalis]|uniref:60S acidic ribosomal protein P0-like n=1 Tax=Asparagus officinalis TaxID=4686 RepID=UPI00098DE332|nr:60S acidic ribosomal protein P0-like [Asparagus officinalis]